MRRSLIAVLVVVLSMAFAGPAAAELSIVPTRVRMLVPAPSGGGDPTPAFAFAARVGRTYRFEVGYSVAGAPRIGTAHVFVFEDAVTGERLDVLSKRFPPDRPGRYRESGDLTIPDGWAPGVYRFRWTVTARTPRLAPVRATGSRVFLVVG
jgi:hypothetical protein